MKKTNKVNCQAETSQSGDGAMSPTQQNSRKIEQTTIHLPNGSVGSLQDTLHISQVFLQTSGRFSPFPCKSFQAL